MNLAEALVRASDHLADYHIEAPRLEAEILLAFYLKIDRIKLIIDHDKQISDREAEEFKQLIDRRAAREPSAYIIGKKNFMSLDFIVDRSVLIPRPETELLAENVLKSKVQSPKSILDIGTGSGVIAVCLARYLPDAKVIGIDTSAEALAIAQKNAERHQVADRCQFMRSDLFSNIKGKFNLIVSNPPYIPSADFEGLEPEVRDWEPRGALDGGPDGLTYIKQLIDKSPICLNPEGRLTFEFGFGQSKKIRKLLEENGAYRDIQIIKDYAGIDRIASAQAISKAD